MPTRVTEEQFPEAVLQQSTLVLVDFYSDSCIPCKRMSPILSELEETYSGRLKIVKVNINFDMSLAEQYKVQAAPTLIFFRNGNELMRLRGAVKKAEIVEAIETYI